LIFFRGDIAEKGIILDLVISGGIAFIPWRARTVVLIIARMIVHGEWGAYLGEYDGPGLVGLHPWPGLCIAGEVGEYLGDVGLNLGLVGE
jgi:hypothetical protein